MFDFSIAEMFGWFEDLTYEEVDINNDTNVNTFKEPVIIKGRLVKGTPTPRYTEDGDSIACTFVYNTLNKLVIGSKLEGREVTFCKKLGFNPDYTVYVR